MTTETQSAEQRTQKLEGLGTRRKRVEDVRFTQGKGNYVDDFKLPGMLFGDFVRSPYGHARVKSISKDAALALPGVKAVIWSRSSTKTCRRSSIPISRWQRRPRYCATICRARPAARTDRAGTTTTFSPG